jgi:hypothetical protein
VPDIIQIILFERKGRFFHFNEVGEFSLFNEADDLIPIVFFVGNAAINIFFEEEKNGHKLCVVKQEADIDDLVNDFRRR